LILWLSKINFYFDNKKEMKNENFLEQLILKADPDIDDVWLEMMVSDAKPVLEERVFTNIIVKLDEKGRKELVKISWKDKILDWEIYNFLSKNISWYEWFIQWVYEKFENMYKSNYKFFRW